VLIYIYYEKLVPCVDIYPGPQAELFWNLEKGKYSDELPSVMSYIRQGGSHIYANVSLESLSQKNN